jgi:homocysteine S-methyltransferase
MSDKKIILLDGAMGTELQRRGIETTLPLWSAIALEKYPEVVLQIHRDYVQSGADIITTNTFRTLPRTYKIAGYSDYNRKAREMLFRAVSLAKDAAENDVLVAGSIAPLEDCYSPREVPPDREILRDQRDRIEWFAEADVDLLLLETFNTIREAKISLQLAKKTGLPVWASFVCEPEGKILSGESVKEGFHILKEEGADALLVNCTSPETVGLIIESVCGNWDILTGGYANVGLSPPRKDGRINKRLSSVNYTKYVEEWIRKGATIVGGCCGTTPEHIKSLRTLIDKIEMCIG